MNLTGCGGTVANLVDREVFQICGFYKLQNRGMGTASFPDAVQANAFSEIIRYCPAGSFLRSSPVGGNGFLAET